VQPGLAINPETPVAALVPFLRLIDAVLIMGVQPGWSGQKLQPLTLKKADAIRLLSKRLTIGFDGGVTARHLPGLVKRGITRLCMASALFKQRDPDSTLRQLQKRLRSV
jgi:ribulose-phosphate 3-epimerase